MNKLKELIDYKYQKKCVFGNTYNFYIEWISDQLFKSRNIKAELDKCNVI